MKIPVLETPMNKKPAFVIYPPPSKDFPFLAVTLTPDGSASARPFHTEEEASAHNRGMAAQYIESQGAELAQKKRDLSER